MAKWGPVSSPASGQQIRRRGTRAGGLGLPRGVSITVYPGSNRRWGKLRAEAVEEARAAAAPRRTVRATMVERGRRWWERGARERKVSHPFLLAHHRKMSPGRGEAGPKQTAANRYKETHAGTLALSAEANATISRRSLVSGRYNCLRSPDRTPTLRAGQVDNLVSTARPSMAGQ
jgi:hypothetical protein